MYVKEKISNSSMLILCIAKVQLINRYILLFFFVLVQNSKRYCRHIKKKQNKSFPRFYRFTENAFLVCFLSMGEKILQIKQ